MAVRSIVMIDEDKCDGCGLCVPACAEGALQIVDGKARLAGDNLCDGLGACLGECPQDAITVIEREAEDFDEGAVVKHLAQERGMHEPKEKLPCGCPGSALRSFEPAKSESQSATMQMRSELRQWPVQLMLVPPGAPFLKNADILLCADCVPFAVPDFHSKYLAGKSLLVACPKLDNLDFYREKLKDIMAQASPRSITVLKMEVPCCNGIAHAAMEAREAICPEIPFEVETISIRDGDATDPHQNSNRNDISGEKLPTLE